MKKFFLPSFLFIFAFLALQSSFAAEQKVETKSLDKIVAIVNDSVIMSSELNQKIELFTKQMEHDKATIPDYSLLRKKVLDTLIDVELQLQVAKRAGISVSEKEVAEAISTIAQKNNMTVDQFKEALHKETIKFNDFSKQIRDQMILVRVAQQVLARKITITEQDVSAYIKKHNITEQEFDTSKKEIQEAIYHSKFGEAMQKWLKELRDSAYIKTMLQ